MKRKVLSIAAAVMWGITALGILFILVANIISLDPGDTADHYISYGWLLSLCLAMGLQTLRTAEDSSSRSVVGFKLMFVVLFFISIVAGFIKGLL